MQEKRCSRLSRPPAAQERRRYALPVPRINQAGGVSTGHDAMAIVPVFPLTAPQRTGSSTPFDRTGAISVEQAFTSLLQPLSGG